MPNKHNKLEWLEEFERLAEEVLSQQETSAYDQIYPIVKTWYEETLNTDFPASREAVIEAVACLTSEVFADMPDSIFDALVDSADEEEVAIWLFEVLMLGRAFEQALRNGRLDDL